MIFYKRPQPFNFKIYEYEFSGVVSDIEITDRFVLVTFERVNTDFPELGIDYMGGRMFKDKGKWKFLEKK